jgi:hypothetical protein
MQRLTIDGDQLRISLSPAGVAVVIATVAVAGAIVARTFGPFGLVFMALAAVGGFFIGRNAPYDLRTARVKARRVFPLSTEIDGFEISTEAGGRTTRVWAVDIAEVTRLLTEMGVPVSEDRTL